MRHFLHPAALIIYLACFSPAHSYGQLLVSDDFEGYSTTPIDEYGGSGPWVGRWSADLEYGGGNFLDTGSNIDGIQALGAYGADSKFGTSVSRAFPFCASDISISYSMRANYDVTSGSSPTNLRRLAFTVRNGDGISHFTGQRVSLFFAAGSSSFQWYDGSDHSDAGLTFNANHIYDVDLSMTPSNRAYQFSASNRNTGASISYSGSWTEGFNGESLGSVAFLMRGPSGAGNDAFLDSVDISAPDCGGTAVFPPIEEGNDWRSYKGMSTPPMSGTNHWFDIAYDDSGWDGPSPSGFGYGDCDDGTELTDMSNNYVSVFTRKTFFVPDTAAINHLTLAIDYDDGMVAFVNGQEVARRHMPGGSFNHTTTASSGHEASRGQAAGSPEPKEFIAISPSLLHPGNNVIAASGHNLNLNSSDMTLITELYPNASLVRGPFIQMPSAGNKATIAWNTAAIVDGAVDYGLDLSYSAGTVSNATLKRDHAIELSNLLPGTSYYYRVRSNGEVLDEGNFFKTRPDTNQSFRFVVIGDFGQGTEWMYNIAAQMNARHDFDAFMTAGDNVYGNVQCNDNGSPGWYDPYFFELYGPTMKRVATFPLLGNHDNDALQGQYAVDYFHLPANGPVGQTEKTFSFECGNIHFVGIDSEPFAENMSGAMADTTTWLSNNLENASQLWKIAFIHHPGYTSDGGSSHSGLARVRDLILPILQANGVQVVFQGHNHFYERINPINGVNYITTGAGGAWLYTIADQKPYSAIAVDDVHSYTIVDINGGRMNLKQFSEFGDQIDEYNLDINHAFMMDGLLDDPAWERADNGLKLYAAIRGHNLYVATQDAGEGSDHFIYVADTTDSMQPANWSKAGSIMKWGAFLADENDGGFQGWFDVNDSGLSDFNYYKSMTSGLNDNAPFGANGVMEGSLDLVGHFGSFPQQLYLAAAPYGNEDSAPLTSVSQVPAGNGDGDIQANEFLMLNARDIALDLPVAQTSSDQMVEAGMWAVFDGNSSYSPAGFPMSFEWVKTNGPAITADNFDQPVAAFVAQANVGANTDVNVRLRVNDGRFDSDDATIRITLVPMIDSDGDGLSDYEETLGFDNTLTAFNPHGKITNPNTPDSDGDGATDGEEAVAGTDPGNSNSVFKVVSTDHISSSKIALGWNTTSGHLFHAQFSNEMASNSWTNFHSFVATSAFTRVFDTNVPFGSQRHYRMLVED